MNECKTRNVISKWIGMMLVIGMLCTVVMPAQVKADEMTNIVLKYDTMTYSTMVYGPEIANIKSGVSVSTATWLKEIGNHVTSSTFGAVTINDTLLKQDVFAAINAGQKLVALDLKNYIKGAEKVATVKPTTTTAAASTTTAATLEALAATGMNATIAANLSTLGIDTKISECSTKYTVGQDRSQNIMVAASRINGIVLQPGDGLSFDAVILPRTTANGYGMGNAIIGDEFIKVVGGGICQVSSTLNNAVLRAGIIPLERHNHSQTVSYLKSGLDATISAGALDYKFVNTLKYPIYISATAVNGVLTVSFYSNSAALNGMTYNTSVIGTAKKNTTYINGYLNGILVGSYPAYSSSYK
jgi:hypothetical protein